MNVSGGVEVRHGQKMVYMCGYLPGATTQRLPLLSPVAVNFPGTCYSWNDVCGGGCGFAMALSESGKLITWGSTNDLGQSYLTSGKHGEIPEPFPLPPEAYIVNAAAGWAHCVTVTDCGEVYTWGWKECIPSGKVFGEPSIGISLEQDVPGWQSSLSTEQVSPRCQGSRSTEGTASTTSGEDSMKRRRVSSAKQTAESSSSGDDTLTALPCLVTLNPGVRIASVAAGGRHTLALSDIGQVWGWGYGGEGQLGLGSRIRMVSSPHLVPCIDSTSYGKDRSTTLARGRMCSEGQGLRAPGSYVKGIACGGRHSVVITDAGALLTFGWGLYGQNMVDKSNVDVEDECGQGTTDDELSPTCVSSLLGIRIDGVAAGLWHTVCTSAAGDVYVFGGNQFGQLGTGSDQAEVLPRLVDSPNLENMHAKNISCGSRHTALLTEGGKVFCWGWNKYGQLGLGDVIDRKIPSEVAIEGYVPKNVACGWWHTLLLA
ncbi:PREDICTED: ultraviolet-B receptor UVR8-like isoform X1 [Lupinus angustifolius]|uniref:ultraviolet-B receptor UVR8-like isoform X1 n=1 Tax=Lupinus angustifolius TaxID=3871 RepID=UPI00092E40AA|nr:PREDICTED: ultraviolet-B receptor UVR8-like isoform X1 [Lupinus angustifolius]XP_019433161.1 PREDICTED: ultraviolet-B receptor UVR8-like isoform X2 [Lupinus angustifolius]XP_019433168.1 PREDICTED: ultraviolet-B receptor UVR8-like isoform X1 [Lupinus angustifolius]